MLCGRKKGVAHINEASAVVREDLITAISKRHEQWQAIGERYRVDVVADGDAALQIVHDDPADVVMADVLRNVECGPVVFLRDESLHPIISIKNASFVGICLNWGFSYKISRPNPCC